MAFDYEICWGHNKRAFETKIKRLKALGYKSQGGINITYESNPYCPNCDGVIFAQAMVKNIPKSQIKDNITLVQPGDSVKRVICSHCSYVFQHEDEQINTINHEGKNLSLCKECYDEAGNSVR